jgi:transposase
MGNGRRKDIERHLTEEELDAQLREETNPEMVRRLSFVKNLYHGDTLGEAADRVGKSQPTGARWADRWNADGVDGLTPDHGDGRPPKLDEDERGDLRELLEADEPWTTQEIRHLITEEFDVTYHPNYIYELLREFGMHYAKPRPKRPERPDDADEILDDRIDAKLDEDDEDDPVTDGGYVVGFSTQRGPSRRTTAAESGRSTFPT